jgi:hypothetical protein
MLNKTAYYHRTVIGVSWTDSFALQTDNRLTFDLRCLHEVQA